MYEVNVKYNWHLILIERERGLKVKNEISPYQFRRLLVFSVFDCILLRFLLSSCYREITPSIRNFMLPLHAGWWGRLIYIWRDLVPLVQRQTSHIWTPRYVGNVNVDVNVMMFECIVSSYVISPVWFWNVSLRRYLYPTHTTFLSSSVNYMS